MVCAEPGPWGQQVLEAQGMWEESPEEERMGKPLRVAARGAQVERPEGKVIPT